MTSCTVLVDAPDEVVLSDGKATSRVQIAKTGTFKDPRYGTFSITLRDFSKWIANFNTLSKGDGRLGLPVDIDHAPEKRGDTEAAGWIIALTIKGSELWATVEWTPLGQELVRDRRYAYLSPSYVADFKDEHGKSHGTALQGVALTNRPFLSMATVSLSAYHRTEEDAIAPSTTQESMKEIALKLGLAEDADEATILAKLDAAPPKPEPTRSAEDLAKEEGKILLTSEQYASLSQNASEGAAAAKQLATMTFESKFATCLSDGKVLPAQKEVFVTMYDVNPETTLKLMESLQPVVNTTPTGAGGSGSVGLSADIERDREGFIAPDADRIRLHERALALETEHKMDYGDAVEKAARELGMAL